MWVCVNYRPLLLTLHHVTQVLIEQFTNIKGVGGQDTCIRINFCFLSRRWVTFINPFKYLAWVQGQFIFFKCLNGCLRGCVDFLSNNNNTSWHLVNLLYMRGTGLNSQSAWSHLTFSNSVSRTVVISLYRWGEPRIREVKVTSRSHSSGNHDWAPQPCLHSCVVYHL